MFPTERLTVVDGNFYTTSAHVPGGGRWTGVGPSGAYEGFVSPHSSTYPAFSIIRQRDVSVSRSVSSNRAGLPPRLDRALGALDRVIDPSRKATDPRFLSGAGDPLYSEVSGLLQRSSFANAARKPAFFQA